MPVFFQNEWKLDQKTPGFFMEESLLRNLWKTDYLLRKISALGCVSLGNECSLGESYLNIFFYKPSFLEKNAHEVKVM